MGLTPKGCLRIFRQAEPTLLDFGRSVGGAGPVGLGEVAGVDDEAALLDLLAVLGRSGQIKLRQLRQDDGVGGQRNIPQEAHPFGGDDNFAGGSLEVGALLGVLVGGGEVP